MRAFIICIVLTVATIQSALAQDRALADCRSDDPDKSVSGCTTVLMRKPQSSAALRVEAFYERGMAFINKGDNAGAIADLTDAIRLDPKNPKAFEARGGAFFTQGDQEKAIADYTDAIRLDPKYLSAYVKRSVSYYRKGDFDRTISDTTEALRIDPANRLALNTRGAAYNGKGEYDRALIDLTDAIRRDPSSPNARRHRGFSLEKKGELQEALAAYEAALLLNPKYKEASDDRERVRKAIAARTTPASSASAASPTVSAVAPPIAPALPQRDSAGMAGASASSSAISSGRRVALVVGNGAYRDLAALPNPPNDARDMAAALRGLDFDVTLIVDGTRDEMEERLATFAKAARTADVAIAFYAGHALQHQEINYLAPVDAKLSDEVDLRRRFIKVQDLIDDLQSAKGVRILVLDACRDNEAVKQLASVLPKSRSAGVTRGLARQEAEGVLIAYATSRNTVARDGNERNSPFTAAMLKYLPMPGLEIRSLFARVRGDVLRATEGKQRPEVTDSLDGEYAFR